MDIISKFNLPSYVKGKSFSEASAIIAKKFKDRNSPEDIATLDELQGRLKQAQEFVKAEQEAKTRPQDTAQTSSPLGNAGGAEPSGSEYPSPQQFEEGGFLDKLFPKDTSGAKGGVGVGGYAQAAMGSADLANQAFGKTGIDTSGASAPPEVGSNAGALAGGAAKGAMAGKSFGPWGAAVGGVIGAGAGLLGNNKKKADALEAEINFSQAERHKRIDGYNIKRTGGELLANVFKNGGHDDPTNPYAETEALIAEMKAAVNHSNQLSFDGMGLGEDDLDAIEMEQETEDLKNFSSSLPDNFQVESYDDVDEDAEKPKFNPAELLRYAPAAMNATQLVGLKKPEQISLNKLDNQYQHQRVDERGLQNTVEGSVNNNRNAILSASGGDAGGTRASLLANSLQGTRALSQAYQSAGAENRQDNILGQEFNNRVDQFNIGQSNQETNLNLEQDAAYRTNKSKLMSQLGDDLGGIGREELFKKYPELMGMSYNWRGKHKKSKNS